jgi:O-antigen/teichoic acid export membrane protein
MTFIASGQFIAQLILVASLPYITRYYNPEEFGIFAVFSAIIGILVTYPYQSLRHFQCTTLFSCI